MKRAVILMALALMLAASVSAETAMKAGPKFGINIANVDLSAEEAEVSTSSRIGFGGGAFLQISFGEGTPIVLQPELLYMMKGAEWDWSVGGDTYTGKTKLTYLDIPVLVKFNIPVEGQMKPNLFAGPFVGFLMSAKEEEDGSEEYDVKDWLKSTNFGVVFGGGVDIVMAGSGTLMIDVRYALGLTNIHDVEGEEMKTQDLSAFIGWGFDL